MDEYAKNRKKFNEKFKRITKKEYDSLTDLQKKQYNAIVERKNIPGIYTGGASIINVTRRGLAEFDSDTYERIKKPMIKIKEFKEKQNRAARFRNYDTDLGFPLPKPARKTAPSENKATGGRVHRGRQASRSAEK